jgi:hypothetical protein
VSEQELRLKYRDIEPLTVVVDHTVSLVKQFVDALEESLLPSLVHRVVDNVVVA